MGVISDAQFPGELRRFGRDLGRRGGNWPRRRDCCDTLHHAHHCEGESEHHVLGDRAHPILVAR